MKKFDGEIELNGEFISYFIKKNPRAKKITVSILSEKIIRVSVPKLFPKILAKKFLFDSKEWLETKFANRKKLNKFVKKKYEQGTRVLFLGEEKYVLKISLDNLKKAKFYLSPENSLNNNSQKSALRTLELFFPNKNIPTQRDIKALLKEFYFFESKQYIKTKVEKFARILDLDYAKIFIKSQRTLWGSCSRNKNLNFCWRLILAPKEVVDYVIAHEVAHLREMNHSRDFWELVSKLIPDYKVHRKWLKENGESLGL